MCPEVSDVFKRLETRKRDYVVTTKAKLEEKPAFGPHVVRLQKGAVPDYIKLTPYEKFCWKVLGGYVKRKGKIPLRLEEDLLKAHMRIRPEEYIAYVLMSTIIVAGVCLGFAVFLILDAFLLGILPQPLIAGLPLIFGVLVPAVLIILPSTLTYMVLMSQPSSKAKARARNIDAKISSAMSFISAMASADVNVDVIFKELSRQPVYGEIKEEAAWITRDTELLGVDILSAIRKAAQRTPSSKFQDFLQGVVTTSTSGGQLKPYFLVKAEQFEKEAKLEIRKKMETLGMLAETFVTVVVAFPLFLVVILAIMVLIQSNPDFMMRLLWAVVGLMIPLSQFGFIFVIWNMSQEA